MAVNKGVHVGSGAVDGESRTYILGFHPCCVMTNLMYCACGDMQNSLYRSTTIESADTATLTSQLRVMNY